MSRASLARRCIRPLVYTHLAGAHYDTAATGGSMTLPPATRVLCSSSLSLQPPAVTTEVRPRPSPVPPPTELPPRSRHNHHYRRGDDHAPARHHCRPTDHSGDDHHHEYLLRGPLGVPDVFGSAGDPHGSGCVVPRATCHRRGSGSDPSRVMSGGVIELDLACYHRAAATAAPHR